MLRQQLTLTPSLLIAVSPDTVAAVRRQIHACEECSRDAQISFGHLLDRFIGRSHPTRSYLVAEIVYCPWCMTPIETETLVELQTNMARAAAMGEASSAA